VLGALTGVSPWRAQSRLLQQRVRLQKKLPEVKKALDTVTLLLGKQARAACRRAAARVGGGADARRHHAGHRGGEQRRVSADGQHLRKGACASARALCVPAARALTSRLLPRRRC
jgi:hypothetical protein